MSNLVLSVLNLDKTNIIKFIPNNSPHFTLSIGYKEKYVEETVNIKFLSLWIDTHLNWKNQIDQMMPKLSEAWYAVRWMFCISSTPKSIYFTISTL
jgi:hypothetical protein